MGVRRQAREAAVQAVYMCDFLQHWQQEEVIFCLRHYKISKAVLNYALVLTAGVIEHLSSIDTRLTYASQNWSVSRMGRVDRAVLRVAAFELLYQGDEVPKNVVINEAIEVAKSFNGDDSAQFINGVLDRLANLNN